MTNLKFSELEGQEELIQYLYDLEGCLVVEDVLSAQQVKTLNDLIDNHVPALPENWEDAIRDKKLGVYNIYRFGMAGGSYPSSPGFLDYGQPFVDLMDHPLIMNIMRMQLGDCFRLDRIFGMRMQKGMPSGRLHSDYGASEPFTRAEPGKFYPQPAFQALHGFGVAAVNLTDSGPDTGGLCLIPGSHNSHNKLPDSIRQDQFRDVVVCPEAPAGSVVFFSEATTHGTATWTAGHERRTILYKYCASQLSWSRTRVTAPKAPSLTPLESRLLDDPAGAHWFFDSLFAEDD
jgi:hypothetical protein